MPGNLLDYKYLYRRNLPHIQPRDTLLFVTYRLAFILPDPLKIKMERIKNRFRIRMDNCAESDFLNLKTERYYRLFDIYDSYLGARKESPNWLQNEKIAEIIMDSLFFNHEKLYKLICFTIMPNHVHLIFQPLLDSKKTPYSLAKIMKDHKGYTASAANKVLNRQGQFWHHESYDHFIRDTHDFNRIVGYILENPVKAKLVENYQDWHYSWLTENP